MKKHTKLRITLLGILIFSLGACAAAGRIIYPLQLDPLKNTPGIYQLDPSHANIIFAVSHLGFSLHHGRFNTIEGSLELDTAAPENSRLFISVQTGSIDTNNSALDGLLRAKEMFNSPEFPTASFESTALVMRSEKTATIEGFLTVKGIRKAIAIEASFIGSGTNPLTGLRTLGFSGSAQIRRSDFGLKEWLPWVGDTVDLIIEAEFSRAKN